MPKKVAKAYVNTHHFTEQIKNKKGIVVEEKEVWFCGYRVGKKYKEQAERYASEQEAKDALLK